LDFLYLCILTNRNMDVYDIVLCLFLYQSGQPYIFYLHHMHDDGYIHITYPHHSQNPFVLQCPGMQLQYPHKKGGKKPTTSSTIVELGPWCGIRIPIIFKRSGSIFEVSSFAILPDEFRQLTFKPPREYNLVRFQFPFPSISVNNTCFSFRVTLLKTGFSNQYV
jgi:hypothetical protein